MLLHKGALSLVRQHHKVVPNIWQRYQSSNTNSDESKQLTAKENTDIGSYKVKPSTSLAAPSPLDNHGVNEYMNKSNKPYLPKLKHARLSYEYPGLPNQDDFTKQATDKIVKPITRWRRYVPKILTAIFIAWGAYTIKVWMYDEDEGGADSKEILDPNEFHVFIISHKEQIDKDHYLIELTPKFQYWQYSFYNNYNQKSLWDGDKIWSIEVKQPQIMVVRSYTPLPVYYLKSEYTRSGERKPLMKVISPDNNDYDRGGVMTIYIKRYDDGEVSRYLTDKNIGDEIEVRGPHIEYKFPYHPLKKYHERPVFKDLPSKVEPELYLDKIKTINELPDFDNVSFYCAGTGIAPALQVLMSRNPYRGFMTINYSARTNEELGTLQRFLFFLEKLDRVKVNYYYDCDNKFIDQTSILKPQPFNYISSMKQEEISKKLTSQEAFSLRSSILEGKDVPVKDIEYKGKIPNYENALEQAKSTSLKLKTPSSLSIVCGPDGYIEKIAGPLAKATNEQGPVGGLLGENGWNETNVCKLIN